MLIYIYIPYLLKFDWLLPFGSRFGIIMPILYFITHLFFAVPFYFLFIISKICWTVWVGCNRIKDMLPERHSCINLYPCVIKFSQSVSQSVSQSLSVCLCVCLSVSPPPSLPLSAPPPSQRKEKTAKTNYCFPTMSESISFSISRMGGKAFIFSANK